MERIVMRAPLRSSAWLLFVLLLPSAASAQTPAPPAAAAPTAVASGWIGTVGVVSTTVLGDCTDCEATTYFHTGSLVLTLGRALNPRAALGAETIFVASKAAGNDRIRVTFLMASINFRPWVRRGFFIRASSGMAFVHNWIFSHDGEESAFRSKAFALNLTAGWEWRLTKHFGAQVLGSQHVAALGDLQTSEKTVENVMGNFWSVGAAIVIR
jgi:hypothetical protein